MIASPIHSPVQIHCLLPVTAALLLSMLDPTAANQNACEAAAQARVSQDSAQDSAQKPQVASATLLTAMALSIELLCVVALKLLSLRVHGPQGERDRAFY